MTALNELIEKDLAMPETYEKIQRFYLDCLEHLLIPESRRFADLLENKIGAALQASNPDFYQKYQQMIILLKFIALVTLDKNTMLKLFQFHILDVLASGIDLNDRMTGRMYLLPDLAWNDEAQDILQALKENKQRLGSQSIILKDDIAPSAPLIKNWLADYDRTFGPEKQSVLQQQQYLTQNPNVKLLPEPEKNILKQIIQFYDNLKPIPASVLERIAAEIVPPTMPQPTPETAFAAPPIAKPPSAAPRGERSEFYEAAPSPIVNVVKKSLRQLVKDNKDALNQTLTNAPIKIIDFDQPVRGTIKNWLVDYVKIKGAGHHEALERSDYLFNSPNSRALSEEERALVTEILKAYDDDLSLPINAPDQTILLEKLVATAKTSAVPHGERSEFYGAAPRGSSPAGEELYGGYREPISQEDLAGPLKQTPPKPTPRLSGNIIDLKDMQ